MLTICAANPVLFFIQTGMVFLDLFPLLRNLSIYLSSSFCSTPVIVECTLSIWFQSSYSFYGGVICTPPPTLPSCPGLGPAKVQFFGSCGGWFFCSCRM